MTSENGPPADWPPDWVGQLFTQFLDAEQERERLLHLLMRGIAAVRGMPKALEVLAEIDNKMGEEETRNRLEHAKREAELAQQEIDRRFPLLHAQATVSLWSALEGLLKTFLAKWLQNRPEALQVEAVRKLRPRLGDYLDRTLEEQFEYLADLLDEDRGSAYRYGVNRFELLLEPFGLSGPVKHNVQTELFVLQQLRHVFVYRNGVADRRLVDRCPSLNVKAGETVKVEHDTYIRLSQAAMDYVLELIQRTR